MAPEQWLSKMADGASDIFSLGVIIFEVMSRGMHPLGMRTSDWWPIPHSGNSKKWLRDDVWRSWARNGCPISDVPALSADITGIARDCMSPVPASRPSLHQVQARLLQAIRPLDGRAYQQACSRINCANNQAQTTADWPLLSQRLERLREAMREDGACAAD